MNQRDILSVVYVPIKGKRRIAHAVVEAAELFERRNGIQKMLFLQLLNRVSRRLPLNASNVGLESQSSFCQLITRQNLIEDMTACKRPTIRVDKK